jgi:hypothetical protein
MNAVHRTYQRETYSEKIDVLREVFATPGVHTLKDRSDELDRLQREARDIISIHHRAATLTRVAPLMLRIEVQS